MPHSSVRADAARGNHLALCAAANLLPRSLPRGLSSNFNIKHIFISKGGWDSFADVSMTDRPAKPRLAQLRWFGWMVPPSALTPPSRLHISYSAPLHSSFPPFAVVFLPKGSPTVTGALPSMQHVVQHTVCRTSPSANFLAVAAESTKMPRSERTL